MAIQEKPGRATGRFFKGETKRWDGVVTGVVGHKKVESGLLDKIDALLGEQSQKISKMPKNASKPKPK